MIRNTDFFEQVDDFCLNRLDAEAKTQFEAELELNEELRSEVQLTMGIHQAITEKEVLNLRETLKEVATQNKPDESNDSFQLLDDFSDIHEISQELKSEELINFYDSLPKAHVYQHEITSNETIHQFYKEQKGSDLNNGIEEELNGSESEKELEGLEDAVLERDILDLRQTLNQVAQSVEPQFSTQEIDEFLNEELTPEQMLEFEGELTQNDYLQDEVNLHEELEIAAQEDSIMDLRAKLGNVIKSETSWNVSEKSIEDFIDGVLEGELLDEFNTEFADNTDLKAEVKLRDEINSMFGESDILDLRNELNSAREKTETKKVKMLIPEVRSKQLRWLRSSVAAIVIVVGLAGLLNGMFMSVERVYDKFNDIPTWANERSVEEVSNLKVPIKNAYMNQEYDTASDLIGKVPESILRENFDLQFYNASSYQTLQDFDKAIERYTEILNQGDNMFIEEAEWYRALCYLRNDNEEIAKQELLAVIERKGTFEIDAKAIIRRLRFSMK